MYRIRQDQVGSAFVVIAIAAGEWRTGFKTLAGGAFSTILETTISAVKAAAVSAILEAAVSAIISAALSTFLVATTAALVADDPCNGPEGRVDGAGIGEVFKQIAVDRHHGAASPALIPAFKAARPVLAVAAMALATEASARGAVFTGKTGAAAAVRAARESFAGVSIAPEAVFFRPEGKAGATVECGALKGRARRIVQPLGLLLVGHRPVFVKFIGHCFRHLSSIESCNPLQGARTAHPSASE